MVKADVLLGLQWGDEGKGKVVDVLTPRYDAVARFQGGPNAGHTLEFDGKKVVLRSIPSGIFRNCTNFIGSGVVLDPVLFRQEAEALEAGGVALTKILKISRKAHLILPTHRHLDAANELAKGNAKIGTTGKGIGPAYTDKVSRNGLRVGDIFDGFEEKYAAAKSRHLSMLKAAGYAQDPLQTEREWLDALDYLRRFDIVDSEYELNGMLDAGKSVLCEGAQGTMLDVDFGSYPFVTSSNTVAAGACTGLGLSPHRIGHVYGIFKAYCTRVGSGPFPTELFDATGDELGRKGNEFGAVTGRKRRCGWIDLVALRYAVMVNGADRLIMMKADVLDGFDTVKACVGYRIGGKETDRFPFDAAAADIEPVYVELPGWKKNLAECRSEADFPQEFKDYIEFVEERLGAPVCIVSVGPDRSQTIVRGEL